MTDELTEQLAALMAEVRRQGRAAVAAQAAAEQCLEAIGARGDGDGDERWLRALLPVVDAVERLTRNGSAIAESSQRQGGWLRRLARGDRSGELHTLVEGMRVLNAQLSGTLEDLGVEVIRPSVGDAFDGEIHRAVEARPGESAHVLELVRPGYIVHGRVVREADVVVGRGMVQ